MCRELGGHVGTTGRARVPFDKSRSPSGAVVPSATMTPIPSPSSLRSKLGLMGKTWLPQQRIDDLVQRCQQAENRGTTRFRGMSYEQGVMYGIRWILGQEEFDPLDGGTIEEGVPAGPFDLEWEFVEIIAREYLKAKGLRSEISHTLDGLDAQKQVRVSVAGQAFDWHDVWACYPKHDGSACEDSAIVVISKLTGEVVYCGGAGKVV